MAAHNWRALRQRCVENGITNPMVLPSLHVVLDIVEQLGVEGATGEAKTATEAKAAVDRFYRQLYRVDMVTKMMDGEDYVPPGFTDDEVEASFDAFLAAGAH